MWAYIDSIDRNGEMFISFYGWDGEDIGYLTVSIYHLQFACSIKGAIRTGDYLDFHVREGFKRYYGNIVYDDAYSVPERYLRCAFCQKSLKTRKGGFSLWFKEDSGDAYHKGCREKEKENV